MTDSNKVALREGFADLNTQLELRRSEMRNLDLQVSRKEAELRRAKEEQALLKELRTVNELMLRKKQQHDIDNASHRLKISQESLSEVLALEDEIKHESKRTVELQESSNLTLQQMKNMEKIVDEINGRIALVKQSTGWDDPNVNSKNVVFVSNEWLDYKKILTALHDEQKTMKSFTATLSEKIEELTKRVELQSLKKQELGDAQETLRQKNEEYENLCEQIKSLERLTKKKERLLDSTCGKETDPYKTLKQMEGDKKVMYNNLSKLRESNVSNSKSILSLEVRLRQLETKLEAVNLFLQQVFEDVVTEEPLENVSEEATEVPFQQFEDLCRDLEVSRQTLLQRDYQLNAHDAKVEQLERKTAILQNAIASHATAAQIQAKGKEKEFEKLMTHVDYMKTEFDEEYAKRLRENTALRAKVGQI